MSGRAATDAVIPGRGAIAVGNPETELPPGWQWTLLTKVARLESGHTPSRRHADYWDGPFPWIGIRDARKHHGGVIYQTEQSITQAGIDNSAARILPVGTVCLSRTASVGYTFVLGKEMTTSQDFVNWICSEAVEPHFLKYAFMNEGRDGLLTFSEGTVHATMYYPAVKAFHVALPPLSEQRRIVAGLDEFVRRGQRAREILAGAPTLLTEFRVSTLASAFRGELTAEWRAAHPNEEPATNLLERIRIDRRGRFEKANPLREYLPPGPVKPVAEGLPELPREWAWTTLEEVTDSTRLIQYGILMPGPDVVDGIPYVKVRNIKGDAVDVDGLNRTSLGIHKQYGRSALTKGDLLMSIRGSFGSVAVVPDELDGANITQDSARIAPLSGVDRDFLRAVLRSPSCQAHFNDVAKGVAVRGVNIGDLRLTRIPLAPLDEQREVARRVEAALAVVGTLDQDIDLLMRDLEVLERAALAKAFRGELAEQDPSDEAVELLLKRVAASEVPSSPKARPKHPKKARRTEETAMARDLSATHLRDSLVSAKRPMAPKELLVAANLSDDIDQFYVQLRQEIDRGFIRERVVDDRIRVIELVHAN